MFWEADLIVALQSLSCKFLDYCMLGLTYLGEEAFFLVAAVVLYWCVHKRFAYKFMSVYVMGVSVTEGLKNLILRPRPFDAYEGTVRSIGPKTHGYSMPSGHTQSISNMAVQINRRYHGTRAGKVLLPVGVYAVLIVMLTRLYLGQHYLTDVLLGLAVGVASALVFSMLFELLRNKEEWLFAGILPLTVIVMLVLVFTRAADSLPDVMKVLGGYGAVTLGYFFEKRYVKYNVRSNRVWKYLVKVLAGAAVLIALKEGLKYALPVDNALLNGYLRYFIIGLFASVGAPALFKLLKL